MVTSTRAAIETSEVVEAFIKMMIKTSSSPSQVAMGVSDSLADQNFLESGGFDIESKDYFDLSMHLEEIVKIFRKVEG